MMKQIPIDAALRDPTLIGAALGDSSSWANWIAVLKAAHGIKLTGRELKTFTDVAQRQPPKAPVKELYAIAGRGSGKSRMAAAAAVHAATCIDYTGRLAPGETGMALVLATSREQAKTVLNYCIAFLEASPVFKERIEQVTAEEIRLKGNIVIAVHSNSFRSIRGPTLICCVFDESAFWRDETSANPDLEVYRAVMPALMRKASALRRARESPKRLRSN
jgi:phage terminase large subunit-like protein